MTGVELLAEAKGLFPSVKSVLLTAYADTDAAIDAINRVRLDYYVLKPWDPPEERLYPVLDDLLDDWRAFYKPAFEGVRVVGPPVVGRRPPPPGLPGPQPRPVPVARRGDQRGGGPAPGRGGARGRGRPRRPPGGGAERRHRPADPV
jgi:CheY-like chemotaxis protein